MGAEDRGDPRDIVIADEGLRDEMIEEAVVPGEGPVELEEVLLLEGGPDRLPQLVLREGRERALFDEGGVIAVDHFAEEIGVGVLGADAPEDLGPERRCHGIGGVEPPAVDPACQPMAHDVGDVADRLFVGVLEADQIRVALEEPRIRPALGVEIDVEEPARPGIGAFAQSRGEQGMSGSDVREHAVEQDPHPAVAAGAHQCVEVRFIAEAIIDREVVGRVVAVRGRLEDRPEQRAVQADIRRMVEGGGEPRKAVGRPALASDGGSACAEGVHMPPECLFAGLHQNSRGIGMRRYRRVSQLVRQEESS